MDIRLPREKGMEKSSNSKLCIHRSCEDSCASSLQARGAVGRAARLELSRKLRHRRRMDRRGNVPPKHSQVTFENRMSSNLAQESFGIRARTQPLCESVSFACETGNIHAQPLFAASEETQASARAVECCAHECRRRASAFFAASQLGSGTAVVLAPRCRSQAEMAAAGARLTHKLLRSTAASSAAFPLAGAGAPAVSYLAAMRLLQIEAWAL
jgi:hypothetical protein